MPSGIYLSKRTKEKIRRLRYDQCLSMEEISQRFTLSRSTVWKILHPKKKSLTK
jgi:transcriptional regulator with XRE-family HTH domain